MNEIKFERIKQLLDKGYNLGHGNTSFLVDTIEELKKELVTVKAAKEIIVELPPLLESDIITLLQKQILNLQLQLSTKQHQQKMKKLKNREWEYFAIELSCSIPEESTTAYYKVKLNPLTGRRVDEPFEIDYIDYMDEVDKL